jgi:hypothetical protein
MPHSTYIEQHLMGTGSMLGNAEIVLPRDDILLNQQIDVVILYFGLYVYSAYSRLEPQILPRCTLPGFWPIELVASNLRCSP